MIMPLLISLPEVLQNITITNLADNTAWLRTICTSTTTEIVYHDHESTTPQVPPPRILARLSGNVLLSRIWSVSFIGPRRRGHAYIPADPSGDVESRFRLSLA